MVTTGTWSETLGGGDFYAVRYKRRPEDGELDSYEKGLVSCKEIN
jgi:hypothetical protein